MEQTGTNKTKMKKLFSLLLLIPVFSFGQTIKPEGIQTITTTGATSISSGVGIAVVNPASALATLTINFPPSPSDRDIFLMEFGGTVTTGTVVTVLTLAGTQPLLGTLPTTAASGTVIAFIYNNQVGKWFRFI